jgi:hypothetical protein
VLFMWIKLGKALSLHNNIVVFQDLVLLWPFSFTLSCKTQYCFGMLTTGFKG